MFRQGSRPSSYEQAAYQTMIYEKYHYIEKVASLRSISKAAQELYISQPALTRIISSVEKELGIMLFNRSVLPLQLTYAGERFLEEARRILDLDAALRKELQEISEAKRSHLSIGANYAANALWLPHILPVFRREYPRGILTWPSPLSPPPPKVSPMYICHQPYFLYLSQTPALFCGGAIFPTTVWTAP